jgi:hypothetical protein
MAGWLRHTTLAAGSATPRLLGGATSHDAQGFVFDKSPTFSYYFDIILGRPCRKMAAAAGQNGPGGGSNFDMISTWLAKSSTCLLAPEHSLRVSCCL